MRLRVKVKNAKECQIELSFPDLCVKYSNGFSPVLKVKEGEEIPLDVCDPEDIRKSLITGSLKGYLENKWIEEIQEGEVKTTSPVFVSQFISEQSVLNSLIKDNKPEPIKSANEIPPQSILPEPSVILDKPIVLTQNEQITDLNLVKSYEDFSKLSHVLKLRFIKESSNLDLLREILLTTPSTQLKNNIQLRFSASKI